MVYISRQQSVTCVRGEKGPCKSNIKSLLKLSRKLPTHKMKSKKHLKSDNENEASQSGITLSNNL